ncbi:hypothetical protein DPMN_120917 [Dreissena polymorpha]|uniref:Uncharacterized protein n=1 Tax=Dreissena polymorpha TaxID=45954 RepID=A0A9D4JQL4_DREPO|nr:hypothetical protein DPMN_120917 [Dreissena polymorpha]
MHFSSTQSNPAQSGKKGTLLTNSLIPRVEQFSERCGGALSLYQHGALLVRRQLTQNACCNTLDVLNRRAQQLKLHLVNIILVVGI